MKRTLRPETAKIITGALQALMPRLQREDSRTFAAEVITRLTGHRDAEIITDWERSDWGDLAYLLSIMPETRELAARIDTRVRCLGNGGREFVC